MNDGAYKSFNKLMELLDDEYNKSSNEEKISFPLDTISVIYFLIIIIMKIDLHHL